MTTPSEPREKVKSTAENLVQHVSDCVETYVKLEVVNATQRATTVVSITLMALLLSVFCLFVLFFVGIGAAIGLGEAWGSAKAGYFAVAGFYVLCVLVFIALRKKVIFPFVRDQIIMKVYE
jgi:uncharacterized membrane protein YqjE